MCSRLSCLSRGTCHFLTTKPTWSPSLSWPDWSWAGSCLQPDQELPPIESEGEATVGFSYRSNQTWRLSQHQHHAEKVKVGQVPFLPFISSSSVLLQLSVEPCQKGERGGRKQRERWKDRSRERRDIARENYTRFLRCDWDNGGKAVDTRPIRTHRQPGRTDGQVDSWTDGRLPPRSTNQPGQPHQSEQQSACEQWETVALNLTKRSAGVCMCVCVWNCSLRGSRCSLVSVGKCLWREEARGTLQYLVTLRLCKLVHQHKSTRQPVVIPVKKSVFVDSCRSVWLKIEDMSDFLFYINLKLAM